MFELSRIFNYKYITNEHISIINDLGANIILKKEKLNYNSFINKIPIFYPDKILF